MTFCRLPIAAMIVCLTNCVGLAAHAQLGPIPAGSLSVTPRGAVAARPLAAKLADTLTLLDYGAVCDGVTDDSAAIAAAARSGHAVGIPAGLVCKGAGVAQFRPFGTFTGPGQVADASGYLRGVQSSGVSSAPNPGSWNANLSVNDPCVASFSCWGKFNYAQALTAEDFYITDSNGGHTLGQPVHGYEYMPGAYPHNAFFNNLSGWNNSLTGNDGRTAAVWSRVVGQQNGQGDMILNEAEILCGGTAQPGSTDWLAMPGCSWEAGDISALSAGQYLQHSEWHFTDGGNDVAVVGRAMGYNRSATTANLNNRWVNDLASCTGAVACDAATVVQGKWRIGIDFTEVATAVTAAIAMQAGQRITLNGAWGDGEGNPAKTSLGNDWITDDGTGIVLAQNGQTVARLNGVAGGVNTWQMQNSASGGSLLLAATGTDGAVPVVLADKGGGGAALQSNGAIALVASNIANAVNHWHLVGGPTGYGLSLYPEGTDTAIPAIIGDKGGAGILLQSNGAFALKAVSGAGATAYAQMGQAASGQSYVLQVQSLTPTNLTLAGSGGGAVHAAGSFVVDMQTPTSSTAPCVAGQMTFDTSYHYDCVATNTWKRTALATW